MPLVAGVDSSIQACKVVVRDAESGQLVREGRAAHPAGTEVHPAAWEAALQEAAGGILDGVAAMSVGAQQHGMVALDKDGVVIRPALLWNDTRSAPAAVDLIAELGGPDAWARAVGSVPVASFTITKLRWLRDAEPANARRVETVLLPHDWLTWRLAGGSGPATTDRGDASGTGYWSPQHCRYRDDLLERALGHPAVTPRVARPAEFVGRTPDGILLAPGTGDNMAAALGLAARPGDAVVSIGTSGVVAAVSATPTADGNGYVAGFADATGRFLPLACTLNAARVLDSTARLLGVGYDRLDELALSAPAGSDGLVLLPYLEGERTPDRPDAAGVLAGLTLRSATPQHLARAALEGLLCMLADGLDALRGVGVHVDRALLVGGGAKSFAVRRLGPAILGVPVLVPPAGEAVADGAARQAAWALSGAAQQPDWVGTSGELFEADPQPEVRAAYAAVRDATGPEAGASAWRRPWPR